MRKITFIFILSVVFLLGFLIRFQKNHQSTLKATFHYAFFTQKDFYEDAYGRAKRDQCPN
jgi:hypothetical protein